MSKISEQGTWRPEEKVESIFGRFSRCFPSNLLCVLFGGWCKICRYDIANSKICSPPKLRVGKVLRWRWMRCLAKIFSVGMEILGKLGLVSQRIWGSIEHRLSIAKAPQCLQELLRRGGHVCFLMFSAFVLAQNWCPPFTVWYIDLTGSNACTDKEWRRFVAVSTGSGNEQVRRDDGVPGCTGHLPWLGAVNISFRSGKSSKVLKVHGELYKLCQAGG